MRATPKSSSYIQLLGTSSPAAILPQPLLLIERQEQERSGKNGPVKIPQKTDPAVYGHRNQRVFAGKHRVLPAKDGMSLTFVAKTQDYPH